MKKSDLKRIINEIVRRKLTEAKEKPAVYGYIMKDADGFDPNDPTYQLIGYGNMPKSLWKKKLERYAEELLKRIKNDDWRNAAYFMEKNGVFNSAVNMMKEISEQDLNEELSSTSSKDNVDQTNQDTQNKVVNPNDPKQKALDAAMEKRRKTTDDMRKTQGSIADIEKKIDPQRRKLDLKLRKQQADLSRATRDAEKAQDALTKKKV